MTPRAVTAQCGPAVTPSPAAAARTIRYTVIATLRKTPAIPGKSERTKAAAVEVEAVVLKLRIEAGVAAGRLVRRCEFRCMEHFGRSSMLGRIWRAIPRRFPFCMFAFRHMPPCRRLAVFAATAR